MGKITLLDGGFSTQLAKHVGQIIDGDPLWSARFLATDRSKCIAAHRDYIRAGADIITTGTYQSSEAGYKTHLGLSKEDALLIMKQSVSIAREAIKLEQEISGSRKKILVAGSVGPYGATLHDGSEYRGEYGERMSIEELINWHRPRVEALIQGGADILAFETLPCSIEAVALLTLLKEYPDLRAWLSFSTMDDTRISNGEKFEEVAKKCWKIGCNQLLAIGVNCLHPSRVSHILKDLKDSSSEIPLIAYPNSGETYFAAEGTWRGEGSFTLRDHVAEWLDLGVTFIGGCCRTTDKDIADFAEEIRKWEMQSL